MFCFPLILGVLNASFSYVFLCKIIIFAISPLHIFLKTDESLLLSPFFFFTLIYLQLFSFCIIPGLPRLATAICGARTLVKIFFRKFIIKSWSLEVLERKRNSSIPFSYKFRVMLCLFAQVVNFMLQCFNFWQGYFYFIFWVVTVYISVSFGRLGLTLFGSLFIKNTVFFFN